MSRPGVLIGCIADDFTGATDIAGTLVRAGMKTVQTIGIPDAHDPMIANAEAIVVALKSRTIAARDAVTQSLAALDFLRSVGCRQIVFKYCSTFDSTEKGNIGPVTEALAKALGQKVTIAAPSFPANGRTVYNGHLFVGHVLLNESGMQNHPLTPMKDANLVRVLQAQSKGAVGLIDLSTVLKGAEHIRAGIEKATAEGVSLLVVDAISEADLRIIGQACRDHILITGGSGIALNLPDNFRASNVLSGVDAAVLPTIAGKDVVLAGSGSLRTNLQVARWMEAARPAYRIDVMKLAAGEPVVEEAVAFFDAHADQTVLIYATSPADELRHVQAAIGAQKAGEMVEHALGRIAQSLRNRGVRRFVVAGGETSGAVVQALDVKGLRIGAPIAPGVPATVSTDDAPLALALKSGNFGEVDFFEKALLALSGGQS
ncbi:3-oxo-tetronate kinase [Brytella acorum]|uniref:3-oxo-tetronate kinase n=1 Tax=Brytella acorum TaxID=2959299 RepID=A0AA35UST7_9PROT|nr:3-oxo-tetronate kinase [Brytella acorum]MDF3625404.1 four-carbon acid sugar kinase family protein [Brytella acorum]CAI9121532.1 four-carbon acid sugar kinase family protein [Brytella acorum]